MSTAPSTIVSVRRTSPYAAAFLLLFSVAWPQSNPIRFDHITTKDGLSQDIVTSVIEDSRGFMWFGTEDGLNRYDGYSIRTYKNNPLDSTTIAGNSIGPMLVDNQGRLWISSNGLNLYDERTDRFIRNVWSPSDPFSLPNDHVTALCRDSGGSIWAGTDEGLARLDSRTGKWTRYKHDALNEASLSASAVRALLVDGRGTIWIGTENGLDRYDASSDRFVRFLYLRNGAKEKDRRFVQSIFEGGDGMIWLGTNGSGLIRFDPRTSVTKRFTYVPHSRNAPADNIIFAIEADHLGRLWIGHFGGLDIFDPSTETFDHYKQSRDEPDAIIGDRVYAIYADTKKAMWLGTYHGGVDRFDPHRHKFALYRSFSVAENSSDGNILSLLEDSKNNVWIGTQTGLAIVRPVPGIDGPDLRQIPTPPAIEVGAITALFEDSHRTIWIGYDKPGTLERLNSRGQVVARYPFQGVRTVTEDRTGNLWFGTREDGLICFSPGSGAATLYRNKPENPDSLWGGGVWCLFTDKAGNVWVSSSGDNECLNRFDVQRHSFTHFGSKSADAHWIPGTNVRSIHEDSSGTLWFGLWGGGLIKYERTANRFTRYLEGNGLPSNYVKAVLRDGRKTLWISTERGISRFDPQTEKFRNYTVDDGLQGDRFYSGSALRSRNGTMYFGGDHGLNVFHPDSVRDDEIPPVVRLTSFKVFDKLLNLPDAIWNVPSLELSYRQDFISFEFVALDYSSPLRNRYAYKLEGFDQEWIDAGERRYAAYTHLDGGTYTFRVKAANGDGIWNDNGTSIQIIIHPPYWKTFWFRFLVAVAIVAAFYLAYRIRLARVLAVERLRQRIAQDLHDDVGTNLSTIALASQSLARKRGSGKEAIEALERIGAVAQRTTDQMKDIVWILKTNNDSLDNLVTKMREVASQLLVGTRFKFEIPTEELLEKVDLEFKRNIFLFYKECLNNIAKHSAATEVTIKADYSGGLFLLQIDDNGKGFDKQSVASGSGLQNLRARAKQIKGSVTINSDPGHGTHISLAVKTTQMRHSFRDKWGVV